MIAQRLPPETAPAPSGYLGLAIPENLPPFLRKERGAGDRCCFQRGSLWLDYRLTLVRVTDNLGRNIPFENNGGGLNNTSELLTVPAEASTLNLVFGYEPIRLITFQAKPEIYRPPKTSER